VTAELGPPEVLIHNAGPFQMGGTPGVTPLDFERCWKVNCVGAFLCAQQVLPALVERGPGTLLFTGATAGLRGSVRFSRLAVGKFGFERRRSPSQASSTPRASTPPTSRSTA
jgi:NAD(P)-dependent dehydrogenase (short-subunit alcohol dehydrogenase family)